MSVNATIAATDRAGAAEQAEAAAEAGFECVKVKVGTGDDAARVAAVRAAAGRGRRCAWTRTAPGRCEQAVRAIEALAPAGLELVEEPTHGLQAIREVRERVSTRVAIDETAAEHGALGAGVADAVCLKISRCGGISGLLAAATLVRASGAEPYVASTLDGPLGVAAALHAAAALASRGPVARMRTGDAGHVCGRRGPTACEQRQDRAAPGSGTGRQIAVSAGAVGRSA